MAVKKHNSVQSEIFRRGSRTYYYSSIWFPDAVRRDVFTLYAFVRSADDFVDAVPQDANGFFAFRSRYDSAVRGEVVHDPVIDPFVRLMHERGFDPQWVTAFLDAMEQDLSFSRYETFDHTIGYMYGSAEVVGLMMSRILGLPEEALESARMLGRAMQYINFIRDIAEDLELGRTYFPAVELERFELSSLNSQAAKARPDAFRSFIQGQLEHYFRWQSEAEKGFRFIPYRTRIPVRTASELYKWTGRKIWSDPEIIFRKKVKPSRSRVLGEVMRSVMLRPVSATW
jgi:15-cis-phytoene synthase